jgi:hypothetical protein
MMTDVYTRALEVLERYGPDAVGRRSGTVLEQLRGTYDRLARWGCSEDVCHAAVYHSIYRTEVFETQSVPPEVRDEVRDAIGEAAEELAFLYSAVARGSLYRNLDIGGPYVVMLRNGDKRPLRDLQQFGDLMALDLANRLEQLPRVELDRGRMESDRRIYERAAPLLPAVAVAEVRRAFPPPPPGPVLLAARVRSAARRALQAVGRGARGCAPMTRRVSEGALQAAKAARSSLKYARPLLPAVARSVQVYAAMSRRLSESAFRTAKSSQSLLKYARTSISRLQSWRRRAHSSSSRSL